MTDDEILAMAEQIKANRAKAARGRRFLSGDVWLAIGPGYDPDDTIELEPGSPELRALLEKTLGVDLSYDGEIAE